MELLDAFNEFKYSNEIGPGVYDIQSPNIPSKEHMVASTGKAAERIPGECLWVGPDYGLKTLDWKELIPALKNMVAAADCLRQALRSRAGRCQSVFVVTQGNDHCRSAAKILIKAYIGRRFNVHRYTTPLDISLTRTMPGKGTARASSCSGSTPALGIRCTGERLFSARASLIALLLFQLGFS